MKIFNLTRNRICLAGFGLIMFLSYSSTAQFKLYSKGNISIGSIIQPPAGAEMQVNGNSVFSKNTGVILSSAYIKGLNSFSTDSLPEYTWWGDTLTGIFHPVMNAFAFSNAGVESMRLTQSNNILFGTTTDNGDRVQVTGSLNSNPLDIYSNSNSNTGYSGVNWLNDTNIKAWTVKYNSQDKFYVYGTGQAYAYGWNTISDSTLKENVNPISNALEKVLKLQGVTYNLKQTETASTGKMLSYPSSKKMGLIAQSVERVAPEVVTTTSDGIKTVAYGNLVGLLIEAIKQEDTKVAKLQLKLDSCIATSKHPEQPKLYPCKTCPVNEGASIKCYIPTGSSDASLMVFDVNGILKKSIPIAGRNEQLVSLHDKNLTAGIYYYSLVVNGEEVDTHKIIFTE